jgi:site-specific DNA-methyltransferase (adenine-specific)
VYCKLIKGDCLERMNDIPDGSIDCIITDPPYGTTACKWDTVIPFEPMWIQLKRVIKPNGAIVLFGTQPFTSALIMSNPTMFKYEWVWDKGRAGNFVHSKFQPLKIAENILIFGNFPITYTPKGGHNYRPQMEQGEPYSRGKINDVTWNGRKVKCGHVHNNESGLRFPKNIIKITNSNNKSVHPTQKPVALMEYLIKTYTNEGETVLDFTMGSGTTGVACKNLNRSFIGIELDEEYFEIAKNRINNTIGQV